MSRNSRSNTPIYALLALVLVQFVATVSYTKLTLPTI